MPKPESRLRVEINGHVLCGERRRGKWTFECASWPDLAIVFRGADSFAAPLAEFTRRALAGAVEIREGLRQ